MDTSEDLVIGNDKAKRFQNPYEAFESFVRLVRDAPVWFEVDADLLFDHLRPFLDNPNRDAPYVQEIVNACGAAFTTNLLSKALPIRTIYKIMGLAKTQGVENPGLIERLDALATGMRKDLKPGSISLNVRPVRFIELVEGYGLPMPKRYGVQVQTLVDPPADDVLHAFSLEISVSADGENCDIDSIYPTTAFSTASNKSATTMQSAKKRSETSSYSVGAELAGGGAKLSSSSAQMVNREIAETIGGATERTVSRVEEYLTARKIGNRAIWRAISGIGAFDIAGGEYSAEVFVPIGKNHLDLAIEARVDWFRTGSTAARETKRLVLPLPKAPPIITG